MAERTAEEAVKALYEGYTKWCEENGEHPITKHIFGQRLQELRFEEKRTGKARKRRGIRLKTEPELMEHLLEA